MLTGAIGGLRAADKDLIPQQLPQDQQANLLRFLEKHQKPERYVPPDAKVIGGPSGSADPIPEPPAGRPIKQYTVQITSHRPVPGQDEVKRVDVYYYRPNPEKGKAGITVRHTVDLTTGEQVGATEVLIKHHTAVSREELSEAVQMAREKSPAVRDYYKDRDAASVHWEYLQMKINGKHEHHEPGDRVIRLVFTAATPEGQATPAPLRVIVNLTKEIVVQDAR